ncbi:MAG: DinB family protein [Caldilineaceae bacterium]
MDQFFTDYLERLAALHKDITNVLDRLPQAALDWQPGPNMNSIAVLVAHTTGAETYWIGDMTVRQASTRVRAREFATGGLDHAALQALLDRALADAQNALAQLTGAQLTEERSALNASLMTAQAVTVGWCLLHALEHTATHVGHVQLMGDMWQQENE